jgi:hypothetical protein
MKRIFNFFKWLFGYGIPDTKKTEELVKQESSQIQKMQKSVSEIKTIHEEISTKLDTFIPKKEEPKPRMKVGEIRKLLVSGKELCTDGMTRKEKQYYAKKVFTLKTKKNMKIVFSKLTKCYKYYPNGL